MHGAILARYLATFFFFFFVLLWVWYLISFKELTWRNMELVCVFWSLIMAYGGGTDYILLSHIESFQNMCEGDFCWFSSYHFPSNSSRIYILIFIVCIVVLTLFETHVLWFHLLHFATLGEECCLACVEVGCPLHKLKQCEFQWEVEHYMICWGMLQISLGIVVLVTGDFVLDVFVRGH